METPRPRGALGVHPPSLRPLVCATLIAALSLLLPSIAPAFSLLDGWPGTLSGWIGVESRVFFDSPRFSGQRAGQPNLSVVAQPEWYLESGSGDQSVLFIPFARADSDDERRSHVDIRELNYLHVGAGWELRAGIAKVFWGVAESNHLVDIVNQDDAIEDIDGEDKLGQPMVHLTVPRGAMAFHLFVLPGFRERTFPGRRGRLRPALVIDGPPSPGLWQPSDAEYEADWGRGHVDFAARATWTAGPWDLGVSHFYGTGRDPRFGVRVTGDAPVTREDALERLQVVPIYDLIHQTGLDLQHTGDNVLWKLEVIGRAGQGDYRVAAVGGFEYTFYSVFDRDIDVGVLGEFLYDSEEAADPPSVSDLPAGGVPPAVIESDPRLTPDAPPTPFEHDAFAGLRLSLNDVQSTTLLAGGIIDVEDGSRFWVLEASRRLGDRFRLSLDVRLIDGFKSNSFFSSVGRDDFVQLQLARYF